MRYLNILLNISITLFALSIVMVSLLFSISGNDVAKTQKGFITQAVNDLNTVWMFGGFNLQQSLISNSNKSPEEIEQEYETKLDEIRVLNDDSQRIKKEANDKLFKKAQLMITMFFMVTVGILIYGASVQAFTLYSSFLTLIITLFLFLSEYLFYFFVIKPYTHSTTRILYYKTLNRFLDKNSSYNTNDLSSANNNSIYCDNIKYFNINKNI